jgi:hypothetical protein
MCRASQVPPPVRGRAQPTRTAKIVSVPPTSFRSRDHGTRDHEKRLRWRPHPYLANPTLNSCKSRHETYNAGYGPVTRKLSRQSTWQARRPTFVLPVRAPLSPAAMASPAGHDCAATLKRSTTAPESAPSRSTPKHPPTSSLRLLRELHTRQPRATGTGRTVTGVRLGWAPPALQLSPE